MGSKRNKRKRNRKIREAEYLKLCIEFFGEDEAKHLSTLDVHTLGAEIKRERKREAEAERNRKRKEREAERKREAEHNRMLNVFRREVAERKRIACS